MIPYDRTSGIVLRVTHYGESDKLVTLYSADFGKCVAIAKGARRSKRRFVNKLEEFSHLDVLVRRPRQGSLYFLSEAELVDGHIALRRSYPSFVAATYMTELVLRFTWESDPDPDVFHLLDWGLGSLDRVVSPFGVAALFHLRLLGVAGYEPRLDRCWQCHDPVQSRRRYRLMPAGSLLCDRCRPAGGNNILSCQTLKFLRKAQVSRLQHLGRLCLPARTARESLRVLVPYSCYLLQKDLHSWKLIAEALEDTLRAAT